MKQLNGFNVLNVGGADRISYTYNEVDADTGDITSVNNKGNFCVVDSELEAHVEAIRDFIRKNKLEG